jgi:hypothetical protein
MRSVTLWRRRRRALPFCAWVSDGVRWSGVEGFERAIGLQLGCLPDIEGWFRGDSTARFATAIAIATEVEWVEENEVAA